MEKVLGIGGLFFRADDPDGLAQWYLEQLGISPVSQGPTTAPWMALDASLGSMTPKATRSNYGNPHSGRELFG